MAGSKNLHKTVKKKAPVKKAESFKAVGERGTKKLSNPALAKLEKKYGELTKDNQIIIRAEFSHIDCPGTLSVGFPVYDVDAAEFKKEKRLEVLTAICDIMTGKEITEDDQLLRVVDELVKRELVTIRRKELKINKTLFCSGV